MGGTEGRMELEARRSGKDRGKGDQSREGYGYWEVSIRGGIGE